MAKLEEFIFDILDFTNKENFDGIEIEDCGEFDPKLAGYHLVLKREEITGLRIILLKEFPSHEKLINEFFDTEEDDKIKQCCLVLYPQQNLTERFVNKYGSVDYLIKYGTTKDFIGCEQAKKADKELLCEEEEDEEMIKELQEKLKDANEKLAEKDKELEYYKSKYPEGDLDDEVLESFIAIMQSPDSAEITKSLLGHTVKCAEADDENEVKRMIGLVLDSLEESGSLGKFIH